MPISCMCSLFYLDLCQVSILPANLPARTLVSSELSATSGVTPAMKNRLRMFSYFSMSCCPSVEIVSEIRIFHCFKIFPFHNETVSITKGKKKK